MYPVKDSPISKVCEAYCLPLFTKVTTALSGAVVGLVVGAVVGAVVGFVVGAVVGAVVGGAADLIGALLVYGGDMNLIITVGAVSIGFISGLLWKYSARLPQAVRLLLTVLVAHTVGSVIIKSFGLAAWYFAQYNMPVYILMLWRALNYLAVGGVEYLILLFAVKNKAISAKMLRK